MQCSRFVRGLRQCYMFIIPESSCLSHQYLARCPWGASRLFVLCLRLYPPSWPGAPTCIHVRSGRAYSRPNGMGCDGLLGPRNHQLEIQLTQADAAWYVQIFPICESPNRPIDRDTSISTCFDCDCRAHIFDAGFAQSKFVSQLTGATQLHMHLTWLNWAFRFCEYDRFYRENFYTQIAACNLPLHYYGSMVVSHLTLCYVTYFT